ncbi:MAG: hypothetical protein LBH15_06270 [Treponema sp.]|jgi:integrase|nr:hypothetical protein [Treponema sp.]
MDSENLVSDLLKILGHYGIVLDMDTMGAGGSPGEKSPNLKLLGKKHGFCLKRTEGGGYQVRYKDGNTWLSTWKVLHTENEREAVDLAIREKQGAIAEYWRRKNAREAKRDSIQLYQMLNNYYKPGSQYLQKDFNDNKDSIANLTPAQNAVKNFIVPFLKSKKVTGFSGLTREVYSDFKIFLQGKNFSIGYCNQILSCFNRVLKHMERYDLIAKLPYSVGTGRLRKPQEEEARNKGNFLPVEKLRSVIPFCVTLYRNKILKSFDSVLLLSLAMVSGGRCKEILSVKVSDIKWVPREKTHLLFIYNKKTERFLSDKDEKFRKIPLHPFVVEMILEHIQSAGLGKESYLFSKKGRGESPRLDWSFSKKAITYLLIALQIREAAREGGASPAETLKSFRGILEDKEKMEAIREYSEKNNFHFYSFRHTLITLMGLEKIHPDFNDYFSGHKPEARIRDNYTHINTVNTELFCREYGKLYLDMIEKYFFPSHDGEDNELERREALKEFLDSRGGQGESGGGVFESI